MNFFKLRFSLLVNPKTASGRRFLCGTFMLFVFVFCHSVVSASCGLVVACSKVTGLLALLCVVYSGVFVGFQCGVNVVLDCFNS